MHAYCFFCETKQCEAIASSVERLYGHRSISPRIIQRKWVKGTVTEESHAWLPGYIFVYSETPIKPRFEIGGIIRCLGRDELSGGDLEIAELIYRSNGVIGTVKLAEVGDRCRIADPAWEGLQGTIVKLDRGRKRCCVEYEFDGKKRSVWVGYEMIEPDDKTRTVIS